MEFRKTSGAQAAAHRAPLSETEAPAKRDGRSHAHQPARLGTLALDRRPQLKAALAAARKLRCHVAVAKLDRLSRDVHFISGLKEEAGRVVSIGSPFGTTYVSSAPSGGDFKMFGIKGRSRRRSSQGRVFATENEAARRVHSGNPALRRPSINSFEFEYPPRAINADVVKLGSS
jgi:hypothetical protein